MKGIIQLLAGVFLLQCALGCPQEKEYFPIHRSSDGTLRKRGYPIADSVHGVWPDGMITYCFADDTARNKLKSVIPKSWDMWVTRGTNPLLKMKEGKTSYCNTANRASYLLVSYNSDHVLDTTPGYDAGIVADGPSMNLDPADGFASGTGVSNVAHEIGHAWGLLHEHQRPSLWTSEYGGKAQTNMFTFNCENMKDYASLAADHDMTRYCKYETAAKSIRFSAYNLLPDLTGRDSGTAGVVDWQSIMIYGSTAGAKTVDGALAKTLTKADGSTFGYNAYPSQGDIDTLNNLYSTVLEGTKMGKWSALWSKANPKHGVFYKQNKSDQCSS